MAKFTPIVVYVCVFYPARFEEWEPSILNRRDIFNTTLLTRITAHNTNHKQAESKHKHHIQLLRNGANE